MRPFKIIKSRTMYDGAEKQGTKITPASDPLITRVGKLLGRTKLDDLPQLINILRGEMSFVGPRPQTPAYAEAHYQEYRRILSHLKPGVTDYASVCYRDEDHLLADLRPEKLERYYIDHIVPHKLKIHREYLRRVGLLMDLKILLLTFFVVLAPRLFRRVNGKHQPAGP